jgi:hypothetical protein
MTEVYGTGVKEFDDLIKEHKDEFDKLKEDYDKSLAPQDKAEIAGKMQDKFKEIMAEANDKIGGRDGDVNHDSGNETMDKKTLDEANKAMGDAIDKMKETADGDIDGVVMGGSQLPKLSEIKEIKYIDADTREVVLLNGDTVIVDKNLNKGAFLDLTRDFENQLRVVAADEKPYHLLENGYGLLGDNELNQVFFDFLNLKPGSTPRFEKKGDHLVTITFTDNTGKERKYFAHDGHSKKAFDGLLMAEAWAPAVTKVRSQHTG